MKFTIVTAEQRSEDWFKARLGRLTGSIADVLYTKGKGSAESVGRAKARFTLANERDTGRSEPSGYINAAMQHGIDMEPAALAAYEAATGELVRRTGFLKADDWMVGSSLDGDIDNFTGILETKCPETFTHRGYCRNPASLVAEYRPQIIHNLWTSDAKWCDIASYDDRFRIPLVRVRVLRDEAEIAAHEALAARFLAEVAMELKEIQELEVAA